MKELRGINRVTVPMLQQDVEGLKKRLFWAAHLSSGSDPAPLLDEAIDYCESLAFQSEKLYKKLVALRDSLTPASDPNEPTTES